MRTLIFLIIVILLCALPGCTMQFKATDIEGKGEIAQEYKFDRLAWTQAPSNLPGP